MDFETAVKQCDVVVGTEIAVFPNGIKLAKLNSPLLGDI